MAYVGTLKASFGVGLKQSRKREVKGKTLPSGQPLGALSSTAGGNNEGDE